jgi:hypothetical protein
VACAVQAVSSLFHLAPLVLLGGTPYLRVFNVEQLQALADRLPHFQVSLSAANHWRIDDACRFELPDVPVTAARKVSATLHFVFPWRRANIADLVAPRVRRERPTMEGAGQRRGRVTNHSK